MYRSKWAAICFSLANLSVALWLIIGSLLYVPFPWMLINFFVGAIFLLPMLITINFKPQLFRNKTDIP